MRQSRITDSLFTCFILVSVSIAQAQAGDWRAVESVPFGSAITVKVGHRVRCTFLRATDDELFCERFPRGVWYGPSEIKFKRQAIQQVRLEHSDGVNTAVGAAIGGGVGAALGASN